MVNAGALVSSCAGGDRNEPGCVEGGASCVGKPYAIRISGTDWQPGVIDPPGTELHCNVSPGTFPEAAVTWNDDSGSNEMPHPARITVFLPPGAQAIPSRRPSPPKLLFFSQPSACC